jgi:hypothetical protein
MPLPANYGKGRINVAMGSSNKVEDMKSAMNRDQKMSDE